MRHALLGLSLVLLAFPASADPRAFGGTWVGRGTYVLRSEATASPSVISDCEAFRLVFTATPETFVFESGLRRCGDREETFDRVELHFAGGKLVFSGTDVGSYDDRLIELHARQPDPGGGFRNWRMSMRREGEHLVYEESQTMDGEATPKISFAGILLLQKDVP